jgi:hypothetical protein
MITTETNSKGEKVQVEWEQGDQYDSAGDGHCYMYQAEGKGEDGSEWIGSWNTCDGEFGDITDIEEN